MLACACALVFGKQNGIQAQDTARLTTSQTGMFESHTDVGKVLHPGSVEYDAAQQTYTVAGSGENMWFGKDAFHFAWKKASGDVALAADISFLGKGVNCLLYTSPSPRDLSTSRMPSSA